jgi:hypothetical protein
MPVMINNQLNAMLAQSKFDNQLDTVVSLNYAFHFTDLICAESIFAKKRFLPSKNGSYGPGLYASTRIDYGVHLKNNTHCIVFDCSALKILNKATSTMLMDHERIRYQLYDQKAIRAACIKYDFDAFACFHDIWLVIPDRSIGKICPIAVLKKGSHQNYNIAKFDSSGPTQYSQVSHIKTPINFPNTPIPC